MGKAIATVAIALVTALTGIWLTTGDRDDGPVIYVSAAASLADAMGRLAEEFGSAHGVAVRLDLGSSGLLRKKIQTGAPVDAFVSASSREMDALASGGHVVEGTRSDLLANRLVCVVRVDSTLTIGSPEDLRGPSVRRIAIGDPAHVPAGIYARQALEHLDLWDALKPKLAYCQNARAVLAQVKVGTVEAAIVYESDLATTPAAALAFVFAADSHDRIVYPACVLTGAKRPADAAAFLAFLQSPRAAAVFAECGFGPISPEWD